MDTFQAWLPQVETKSSCLITVFWADRDRKFISAKLWTFYKKRGITIKYTVSYIYEENRLAERIWQTIIIMKNSILIDNSLPNRFCAKAMETANYFQNRLLTKSKNHRVMIPEESWRRQRQNLQYVCIFDSLILSNILEGKKMKSEY